MTGDKKGHESLWCLISNNNSCNFAIYPLTVLSSWIFSAALFVALRVCLGSVSSELLSAEKYRYLHLLKYNTIYIMLTL